MYVSLDVQHRNCHANEMQTFLGKCTCSGCNLHVWFDSPIISASLQYLCCFLCLAQYIPPTPTRRNRFVASASAVWTQFATSSRRLPTDSVDNLETDQADSIAFDYTILILITFSTMTSLCRHCYVEKKLSISIRIHVVKKLWSLFDQFPNYQQNMSAVTVSYMRIVCSPPTPTRQNGFVASASAVCIGHKWYYASKPILTIA